LRAVASLDPASGLISLDLCLGLSDLLGRLADQL
jgi:hypothetical protein